MPKNIFILSGGGNSENKISLLSARTIYDALYKNNNFNVIWIVSDSHWGFTTINGGRCKLVFENKICFFEEGTRGISIDYVIPCYHGFPGETGDIQPILELCGIPYFGNRAKESILCFDKVLTKLLLSSFNIPVTPFLSVSSLDECELYAAEEMFQTWGKCFVKPASQGSSIGCRPTGTMESLRADIKNAFSYSDKVLIEKDVCPRELEVAVYEYKDKLICSHPGEIKKPGKEFYSYDEKYSETSSATVMSRAEDLDTEVLKSINRIALFAFNKLKLRHLARIDFFLAKDGELYVNEINTFPGMTEISLFPILLRATGNNLSIFFEDIINASI